MMRTIPKGWQKFILKDIVDFFNGKAHEKNIDESGKYILVNSKFISSNGNDFKRTTSAYMPLRYKDITMVMSDIPNGKALAKCFLVSEDSIYTLNQRICALRCRSDNVVSQYLFYYLNRNKYFLSFDSGVSQTNLRKDEVLECPVVLPPVGEQKKIAEILSTWDRAIETLDKLIEAKTRLKKALMQKLLTGKIRFKGVKGQWKTVEIGEVVDYERPDKYIANTVVEFDKNKIPVLTANKSFILGSTDDVSGIYKNLPVIIFDDFTTDCKYVDFPFKVKSSAIKILKPKDDNIDLRFIYESMKNFKFPHGKEHKRFFISEYQYFTIDIPDLNEQKKIAGILSAVDREINCLTNIKDKFKTQKQGLMQKLLTGKIRVHPFRDGAKR